MDCDDDNFIERINRSIAEQKCSSKFKFPNFFIKLFARRVVKNVIFPLSAYVLELEYHVEMEFDKSRTSQESEYSAVVIVTQWNVRGNSNKIMNSYENELV